MSGWTRRQQKAHRKVWVKALRSGKYEQATGRLRSGAAMCCLGVACDISKLGQWTKGEFYTAERKRSSTVLPPAVKSWLGLTTDEGGYGDDGLTFHHLSSHNDSGKTFAEIADIIEAEPPGLISE